MAFLPYQSNELVPVLDRGRTVGFNEPDANTWLRLQHELVAAIPRASSVDVVESASGHDGFLVESEAVGKVVARALMSL